MKFEIYKHHYFKYSVLIQLHENTPWIQCGVCRTLRGAKKLVKMMRKVLNPRAKK